MNEEDITLPVNYVEQLQKEKEKIEKALKFMHDKDIVFSFTNVRILREILEGTEEVGEDGEYI